MQRHTCKECLGSVRIEETEPTILVEMGAEGVCVHWNEITLGFLEKMMDAIEARIGLRGGTEARR